MDDFWTPVGPVGEGQQTNASAKACLLLTFGTFRPYIGRADSTLERTATTSQIVRQFDQKQR
jgi:hypothetical protein